jgi:pimeloyl-ACP methyl ester carboxylesterase
MAYARVGDLNINYELKGEGHPLVIIMGLTGSLDWWSAEFIDPLAERYRVLIFDNRGGGKTETPDEGEFDILQMAGDTAGLMEALDIKSAHVMGMSMGGMIAQELALNYPDKVDKLVLAATNCGKNGSVFATRDVLAKMADRTGTPQEQVERFCSLLFCEEWLESHQEILPDFQNRYMEARTTDLNAARQFFATVKFDACERLAAIDKPTLVAHGKEDVIIPAENSSIIAERIPGAKLIQYENAGHGFIWERLDDFLPELMEFLS